MSTKARIPARYSAPALEKGLDVLEMLAAEPPEPMSYSVRTGAHFPFLDDRVCARVITAFQAQARQDLLLRELGGPRSLTPARKRRLDARMAAIRRRGYDEGPSDTVAGVVDICFPLFDRFGVVAALNIVYLEQRDARVSVPQARQALRGAAREISRSLGWIE